MIHTEHLAIIYQEYVFIETFIRIEEKNRFFEGNMMEFLHLLPHKNLGKRGTVAKAHTNTHSHTHITTAAPTHTHSRTRTHTQSHTHANTHRHPDIQTPRHRHADTYLLTHS